MLELLGDRESPSFDDPVGLLRACHLRIGRQLVTLERLARHLPLAGADESARKAAGSLLRYFDNAAPNHHADEAASVFPRLLARTASARDALIALENEHDRLETCWRRLRPLIAGVASGQRANLPPGLAHAFASLHAEHLRREDELLLPLCADWLTREDLESIGREMAARRDVRWTPQAARAS